MNDKELLVLRDLSDEELHKLSDDDNFTLMASYRQKGVPVRATVKGLLDEFNIKYDDLTDFILNVYVGVCNNANRTSNQIYINRKDGPRKDNIIINLDEDSDVPDVTIQVQVSDVFIHEEAYSRDGLLLYKA